MYQFQEIMRVAVIPRRILEGKEYLLISTICVQIQHSQGFACAVVGITINGPELYCKEKARKNRAILNQVLPIRPQRYR